MLCHAGLLMPLVCLSLAEYLRKETHPAPWAAATAHLHILRGASEYDVDFKVGHSSVIPFSLSRSSSLPLFFLIYLAVIFKK